MIHLYYGDGKGKTTAALGLIVRHAGSGGLPVLAQFLKSMPTGELAALETLGVPFYRNDLPHGFFPSMTEETKAAVTAMHGRTLAEVAHLVQTHACTLLVLDELCAALSLNLIDPGAVFDLLDTPSETEIIITGRDPSPALIDRADYITEMKLIRHPYQKGVQARKGIEY